MPASIRRPRPSLPNGSRRLRRSGHVGPRRKKASTVSAAQPLWIRRLEPGEIARPDRVTSPPAARSQAVTFAVKDNIDVAGVASTAAFPGARGHAGQGVSLRRPAADRRRRGAGRQDQHGPVRHRPRRHPLPVRCLPHRRLRPARLRRQQLGLRGRGRLRRGRPRAGHRHGRLRPGAGCLQRHRRAQADQGPDLDLGRAARVPVAGLRDDLHPYGRGGHGPRSTCWPGLRPGRRLGADRCRRPHRWVSPATCA